jgi:integrase
MPLHHRNSAEGAEGAVWEPGNCVRQSPASAADEQLIEAYISHAEVSIRTQPKKRDPPSSFIRRLSEAVRQGRTGRCAKVAKHLLEILGNKTATVEKKVGWLRAAVNMAMEDQRPSFNPFQKVVPRLDDGLQKVPLSDEDMELARKKLERLSAEDQLLWKLLATTGMRLSEAFQIKEEFAEKYGRGTVRYVIVGTKSDASERRVPLPTDLLPELPDMSGTCSSKAPARLLESGWRASSAQSASRTHARPRIACGTERGTGSGLCPAL